MDTKLRCVSPRLFGCALSTPRGPWSSFTVCFVLVLGKELEDLVREEEEDDVCLLAFAATPSFPLPLPYLQLSAAPILLFKDIIEQHT